MARYLVLKKRLIEAPDPFLEWASAERQDAQCEFPFEARTEELPDRGASDLRRDPGIEDVVASIPFTLIQPVEDPSVGPDPQSVWGLDAVGASSSSQTGAGVAVAVLDTGIDRDHPAFSGIAFDTEDLRDFSLSEQGLPGSAPDVNGHGTHVAGTIFGRAAAGQRIGVAPGVTKALIGKVLGPGGGTTEAIYHAIEWALRRRADVISMSLGMDFPGLVQRLIDSGLPASIAASRALEAYRSNVRLFDRLAGVVQAGVARGRGALLVAASGNESRRQDDPRFTAAAAPPAAADGFIPVGAVSRTGDATAPFAVARFSNTGCLVAAPGVHILSAKPGGGLTDLSGTSMAAPHAAGVIALWTQKLFPDGRRPRDWARDVQRALESHVTAAPGQSRNDVGLGVVQAPL